jgi:defect-in-organelle-trafficking protein DotC
MESAGRTLGFQRGLAWRYGAIMEAVKRKGHVVSAIFDFAPLLIDRSVLPPVIAWTGKAMTVDSPASATAVDARYVMVAPARIVSVPPTWRDYLEMVQESLEPAPELAPAEDKEVPLWKAAVTRGWNEGAAHADRVFEMNMDRLVADYRGMLRFRMLVEKGLASMPVLARGDVGDRSEGDALDIGRTDYRLTVPAAFKGGERDAGKRSGKVRKAIP